MKLIGKLFNLEPDDAEFKVTTNERSALPHTFTDPLVGLSESFIETAAVSFELLRRSKKIRNDMSSSFETYILGALLEEREGEMI